MKQFLCAYIVNASGYRFIEYTTLMKSEIIYLNEKEPVARGDETPS